MSFDEKLFFRGVQNLVKHVIWSYLQNSQGLFSVNYFRKKAHLLRCLTGFCICLSILIFWSPLESPLPTTLLSYQFFCAKSNACWLLSKYSSWWRRLKGVFRLHLQKTSWSKPIYSSWSYVFKNVFKTFSRHLQDVLTTYSTSFWDVLQRRFL